MLRAATRSVSGLSGNARRSSRSASAPDFGLVSVIRCTIWASAEAGAAGISGAVGGATWIGRNGPSGVLAAKPMVPLSLLGRESVELGLRTVTGPLTPALAAGSIRPGPQAPQRAAG